MTLSVESSARSSGTLKDVNSAPLEPGLEKADSFSDITWVEFAPDDADDPFNFSLRRKWAITCTATAFTGVCAAASSSYALGYPSMIPDLNCTQQEAATALAMYPLGFGLAPLLTASFSEEFGRQPLYIGSAFFLSLSHLIVAVAQNIETVIFARLLAGLAGSTGATMVGGTVADIWRSHERGSPMSLFSLVAVGATGVGPAIAGWIEMFGSKFPGGEGWRWIQWIHLIVSVFIGATIPLFMKETRGNIVLSRRARKLRKQYNTPNFKSRIEMERPRFRDLLWVSCTRPMVLLLTEPIVAAFSLWIGFAWGIVYSLVQSIGPSFRQVHGFNQGETGLAYLTLAIGSLCGYFGNMYQERLYAKHQSRLGPEARLLQACPAGLFLVAGLMLYAWTSVPSVHWIAMILGISLFMWGAYAIYVSCFTYIADAYGIYASSAMAGLSLLRNLLGAAFPLFTTQMLVTLGFRWSGTLFALIGLVMAPIPFVLLKFGPKIRAKSKFACQLQRTKDED